MTKRRGIGEGSIYRRNDGLWVGQYKIHTPSGTKTKYIYSLKQAVGWSLIPRNVTEAVSPPRALIGQRRGRPPNKTSPTVG